MWPPPSSYHFHCPLCQFAGGMVARNNLTCASLESVLAGEIIEALEASVESFKQIMETIHGS